MKFSIAAFVATSVALATLATCAFLLMPSAVRGPSGGADSARTAGTLVVRSGINERTPNQNVYDANARTPNLAGAGDRSATARGAFSPLAKDLPSNTNKTLVRPGPGTCLGMTLGGFFMSGLIYGLALGPEAAVLAGAGMLAYAVIRVSIC